MNRMDAPFAAADAEAERLRLERTSAAHRWTDGKGRPWDLVIPPTVYPPREDTDLLADALAALVNKTITEVPHVPRNASPDPVSQWLRRLHQGAINFSGSV